MSSNDFIEEIIASQRYWDEVSIAAKKAKRHRYKELRLQGLSPDEAHNRSVLSGRLTALRAIHSNDGRNGLAAHIEAVASATGLSTKRVSAIIKKNFPFEDCLCARILFMYLYCRDPDSVLNKESFVAFITEMKVLSGLECVRIDNIQYGQLTDWYRDGPRPDLDYYDNRRDRRSDGELTPYQGSLGKW